MRTDQRPISPVADRIAALVALSLALRAELIPPRPPRPTGEHVGLAIRCLRQGRFALGLGHLFGTPEAQVQLAPRRLTLPIVSADAPEEAVFTADPASVTCIVGRQATVFGTTQDRVRWLGTGLAVEPPGGSLMPGPEVRRLVEFHAPLVCPLEVAIGLLRDRPRFS